MVMCREGSNLLGSLRRCDRVIPSWMPSSIRMPRVSCSWLWSVPCHLLQCWDWSSQGDHEADWRGDTLDPESSALLLLPPCCFQEAGGLQAFQYGAMQCVKFGPSVVVYTEKTGWEPVSESVKREQAARQCRYCPGAPRCRVCPGGRESWEQAGREGEKVKSRGSLSPQPCLCQGLSLPSSVSHRCQEFGQVVFLG